MIFIIGGYAQGKRQYVEEQFGITKKQMTSGAALANEEFQKVECIYDFHLLVKKWIREKVDYKQAVQKLIESETCQYIISDEVGYGVVPIDAFEREYRENVGRASCMLAKHAEKVIRVTCGIGQTIKG